MGTTVTLRRPSAVLTVGLCFLVALIEGLEFQAPGIAALGMAEAFALDKMQMGWVFSLGVLGLLPGAMVGGWLSDRIGRKRVLVAAVVMFGVGCLFTVVAWSYGSLLFSRLLTGVGLGAALPNLIALSSEAAPPAFRTRAVSLMYCGVPIGAALAALVGIAGYTDAAGGWKVVFVIGGVAPLLIAPLLVLFLPDSAAGADASKADTARVPIVDGLFRHGAWIATLLLWVSYFFTLFVVYVLIQWLPSLVRAQGFTPVEASWVMFWLQIGAAVGVLLLGWMIDRLKPWAIAAVIYAGMLASLAGLGFATQFGAMVVAGFVAGFFATGGQSVLYAFAPLFYRTEVRATGVGSAVAVGRLGAMSGPLLAGKLLAMGGGTAGVMLGVAPGLVLAALSLFLLAARRIETD